MYFCFYSSFIGELILISNGAKIIGLTFSSSQYIEKMYEQKMEEKEDLEIFKKAKKWLDDYFEGKKPNPNRIPIKLSGTSFCLAVLEEIKKIPYGKTITYGEIADKIAKQKEIKKMSAQAVGYAVGHNPVSIIIPCHRVIGKNGNLTGYNSGISKKVALLKHETIDCTSFKFPKSRNSMLK